MFSGLSAPSATTALGLFATEATAAPPDWKCLATSLPTAVQRMAAMPWAPSTYETEALRETKEPASGLYLALARLAISMTGGAPRRHLHRRKGGVVPAALGHEEREGVGADGEGHRGHLEDR